MRLQTLTKTFTLALVGMGAIFTLQSPSQAQAIFECLVPVAGPYAGVPTTAVQVGPNEYKAVIRWTSPYSSGSGYTPKQRCEEVANRFNALNSRPGGIDIITTGYLNGLPVIYSPSNGRERANRDNVLFTLNRGDDGTRIIQQLFDLRSGASDSPLFESSSDPDSPDFGTFLFGTFLDIDPVEIGVTPSSSSSPVPGTSSEQSPQRPSSGFSW
ncbi:MAG: COP23 domain-containing protein [Microcystis aeruginosa]